LFVISAILVWFGANHWVAWPRFRLARNDAGPPSGNAFDAALQAGMAAAGADRGLLLWREAAEPNFLVIQVPKGSASTLRVAALPKLPAALLFDIRKDRVLMRADASRWRFLRAPAALPPGFSELTGDGGGLAVPAPTRAAAPPPPVVKQLAPPAPRAALGECSEPASKPKPLVVPQPVYTDAARAASVAGRVRVELTVDEAGHVVSVKVLEGLGYGLDESAQAAARQATFTPASAEHTVTRLSTS
jgi:TonB family protein